MPPKHSKRHAEILRLLGEEGTITIADLASKLEVSLETVRRDVKPLTRDGAVLKMHGAIGLPSFAGEAPFEKRMRENADAKRAIARAVAATIRDGKSVMLDTGTTTSFLARELLGHRRLTVVTNSSDIARTLATVNGNKVYMAGGELRSDSGAAFGVSAIEFVGRFSVTHSVISTGAIDAERGVMDYDLEEAEFARMVLRRGARTLVVTDHAKFGRQGLVQVCGFDGFDELVTDRPPPAEIVAALAAADVRLTVAGARRRRRENDRRIRLPSLSTPMAFTIRQLQFFVAVAEQGSVSRAARNLSISQSSVTEAVKELESDLGVALFERHPRGLNITHKGHQFLRHATKILAGVSDARRSFEGEATSGGRLQLGVTSLVAGYVLSDILARYRRAFPGVEVTAIEDNGDYLEHLLVGGELDVAVMVISNLRDRMALQAEIIEVSPYRLWLPLGHHLAGADIIGINDIAREPLIMLTVDETEENTGKLLIALGARPHVAFRTRSVEAVRSLVATGAGVALLPDLVYRPWSLEGDRIESRDISGSLPVVQVGMVWRRGSGLPQAARDFIGIAQSQRSRAR